MIANSPIDLQEIFKADWDSIGLPLNKYPWKAPKPLPVPPVSRPPLDIHQTWVNDFSGSELPPESIHNIHGEEQFWTKPPKPVVILPDPSKPTQTVSEEDKSKVAFYDELNGYFNGKLPSASDLKNQWDNLNKWPIRFPHDTPESAYIKYSEPKETHTDYDRIKGELETWTKIFGTETAQSVKNRLDSKHDLSEDEKEAIKLYPATKAERDGWIEAFPYKKPSEVKKDLVESENKYTALEKEADALWEHDGNLTSVIKKAISAQGKIKPTDSIIETPLRKTVHGFSSYSKLLSMNKEKMEKIEGKDGDWLILVEVETPTSQPTETTTLGVEDKALWDTLGFILKESKQGSLILASFILNKAQAKEIIGQELKEVQERWRSHLESTDKQILYKQPLIGLPWKDTKRREDAKDILGWIIDARIGLITYEELAKRWNHKEEEQDYYDYDGSLFTLNLLLGVEDGPVDLKNINPTKDLLIQALEKYLPADKVKEKLGDIREGWLSYIEKEVRKMPGAWPD